MTVPMPDGQPRQTSRTARRFKILIGVVLALVVLWTGGWFAARHYVAGKIAAIEARAADEGATLSCGDQQLTGFPFKLGISCRPLSATCPAKEASLDLAGLEALGLLYNPGHAILAAKGPLLLKGPNGTTANANWTSLQSSLRIGLSGLKRYSLVTDGLDATLAAPSRLAGPVAVKADHAELHLVPDPDMAGMIDVFTSLTNGTATIPGRANLPPVTSDMEIAIPEAVLKGGGDAVATWIESGQPIRIRSFEVDIAGFSAALAGDATIDAGGLLSGDFTVRLSALDRLPDLVEQLHPGSRDRVARVIGPISAFLRPVNAGGKDWREARISVKSGRAAMGFIPLGQIPPLGRHAMQLAATAPPSPPAPEAAPALPAPEPAAAPEPSPQPAAAAPEPSPQPAAAAPAVAPPPVGDAAGAIRDLAAAVRHSRRCAAG